MIVEKVNFRSFGIVTKDDLPFHCPPKDSSKWNMHPKVYLSFDEVGRTNCPYCGTNYRLEQ
tara:strand:- start:281 stop:463 length:183 start_codon:yes stop_codon:yes gene_type:complete